MVLEILSTGSGLALQDQGREGWRRYGVPPGGAMDRSAMAWANRLLGNPERAPVLEIYRQGARFRVLQDTWIALAGADVCAVLPTWTARRVRAGEELACTQSGGGVFAYLAVSGGFQSVRWFGSVGVDWRNGMGEPLQKGTQLAASLSGRVGIGDRVFARSLIPELRQDYAHPPVLRLLPGPQFAGFSTEARECLVSSEWTLSADSDRTGYRLDGPVLEVPESIPSDPVLPGSFQVPGSGRPIVTMVDGPTVGGYPKIAILLEADRDRLAQCAPGTQVSFRWADL